MQRFTSLLLLLLFSSITFTSFAQSPPILQTANTNENTPYKIPFSNLGFGKSEYSKIILNAWKAYDNNKLDDIAFILVDTVKVTLGDGTQISGRSNFLSAIKAYREGFSSVVSKVTACTTVKSPNVPDVEVALIWGTENGIKKDGTTQVMDLHEVWFFDKSGKVTEFHQYIKPVINQ